MEKTKTKSTEIFEESLKTLRLFGWSQEFPKKEGDYWFYGDPYMGQMGGNYNGNIKPDIEMYFIKVKKINDGFMAVVDGQFMSTNKFDLKKRKSGYLGYWQKAIIPDIIEDFEHIFELEYEKE